jgi:hypothetical protein
MSKFPSHQTFKNKKTKPFHEIEKHIPNLNNSPLYEYNILPKKTKEIYIYDILEQKFADFYLNNGKLFLGYTDKYITKIAKNYLKHTINSYHNGIFTYRLTSLLKKITNKTFKYVSIGRNDEEVVLKILNFLYPDEVITNSNYVKSLIKTNWQKRSQKKIFIIEPHDEVFNIDYKILSNLYKVRVRKIKTTPRTTKYFASLPPTTGGNKKIKYTLINSNLVQNNVLFKNIVILSLSRMGTRFKHFSLLKHLKVDILLLGISNGYTAVLHNYENLRFFNITEFEAMLCYYHLLREDFLISKKERELKKNVIKGLSKFYKLGIIKKLSPYGALIEHPKFFNEYLIKEGILSRGNVLYFSFSHNINDFLRLKRKLNSLFFGY